MHQSIEFDPKVIETFQAIKMKSAHRYMVCKIDEDFKLGIDSIGDGETADVYETMCDSLPDDDGRFIVFDYQKLLDDGRKINKLLFIYWCPSGTKIQRKIQLSSNKVPIEQQLDCQISVSPSDREDLEKDELERYVKKIIEKISMNNFKIDPNWKSEALIEDPNVGEFEILSNQGKYTLIKRMENISSRLNFKNGRLEKPVEKKYKNILEFLGYGRRSKNDKLPCAVFEYGPYTLKDIHQNYRNTQRCISENIIWNIFRDITRAGAALERDGLWHPGITANNIVFKGSKERFKLSNPFIHDTFLRDYNRMKGSLNKEILEDEVNKNTRQLGVTLLGMTSLANSDELRTGKGLNQDTVAKGLSITKLLYSGELYSTICFLLQGKHNEEKLTFQKMRRSVIKASEEVKGKTMEKPSFFEKSRFPSNQHHKEPGVSKHKVLIFDKNGGVEEKEVDISKRSDFSRILPPNLNEKSPVRMINNMTDKKMPYVSNHDRMFPPTPSEKDSKDNSIVSQILQRDEQRQPEYPQNYPNPQQKIRGFNSPPPGQIHPYYNKRGNQTQGNLHPTFEFSQKKSQPSYQPNYNQYRPKHASPDLSPIRLDQYKNQGQNQKLSEYLNKGHYNKAGNNGYNNNYNQTDIPVIQKKLNLNHKNPRNVNKNLFGYY